MFLLGAVLVVMGAVFAQVGMIGPMTAEMNMTKHGNVHVEVNGNLSVNAPMMQSQIHVETNVGATVRQRRRFTLPVAHMYVHHVEKRRLLERMERRFGRIITIPEKNMPVRVLKPRVDRFGAFVKRFHEVLRKTFMEYRKEFLHWLHVRGMYLRGEVNSDLYLNETKRFLTTAITVYVNRLESLKENNLADEHVAELIAALKEVNNQIEEVNDLNTLRNLYKETVRPLLISAHKTVREYYGMVSLMAMTGVVVKVEVGLKRMTALLERMGIDVNKEPRLKEAMARIDALKRRIEELKTAYIEGNISGKEFLEQLKELRRDVQRNLMELRKLISEYIRGRMRVAVRARVGTHAGRAGVSVEAGVRGGKR